MLDAWMRGALIPVVMAVSFPEARDAYRDYGDYRKLAELGMETSARADKVVLHRSRSPWDNYCLITYSFEIADALPRTSTSKTDMDTAKTILPGQSIRIVYALSDPTTNSLSVAQAWLRFRDQALGCGISIVCLIGLMWSVCSAFRKKERARATAA